MKMKKFLSALTAFCMGTSMIASALPATALTTAMPNTEKAQAGDFTWSLNNAVMDDDRYVYVEAFVANDPGTNGFTVSVEVQNASGKWVTLKDFGLVYSDSSNGGAYPGMGAFFYNQDNSSVASANMASVDPQYAVENKAVFSIELEVPASIADGVYKTRINPNTAKVAIGNTLLDPTYVTGSLVIGDDVTPPSDDPTDDPSDDPVVTPTGHTWTMNKAATDSDRYAYIEAFVANDPGTNGFTVALEIQNASGKWVSLEEFGLEYSDSSNGGAYPGMGAFFYNQENSSVASANMASVDPQYAVDGKAVFSIEVYVPETIADGVYKTRINPDTAKVAIGNTLLNPTYVTGTLTIGDDVTPPTDDPTDDPSDDPVVTPTGHTWTMNKAATDSDRYAYIEAFVANDPGTNGFTVALEIQNASGKWVSLEEFGLEYSDSSNGGAYPGMGAFFYNQENSSVASANMASVDPQYAVDGKAVFSIEVYVPETIADGVYKTRINPDTAKVAIGNTLLNPTYVTGTLTIGDDVTPPTDDPTDDPSDDPVVTPTGHTWTMNKAATDSDRYAYIEAFVANDPGTNGFTVALEIQNASGKWVSLEEFGLEYSDSSNGGAYPGMGAFFYNQENSSVASANMASVEPQYAVDGKPVFSIEVFVPETIADGVYKTRINPDTAKVAIGNTLLNPTYVTGTLTVGEVEEHIWDLNDAETDADGYATIEAYVTGDPGTNGFETGILIQNADGKWVTPAEFGLVWSDGADGGAYPRMDAFFFNSDKATVAAANNKDTDPQYADPNKPVFSMEFQVPSTIAPGTYKVKFVPETEVGSADGKTVLEPTFKEGTLTISGSDPIETTTKEIDAEWIIGTVEAAPGETVTVPVTVKGDVDGINSYIADLGQDAGPVATEATAGDAYASLDFAANMDTLAFGGTNYSIGKNVVAADGAVVFNVTFTVPADASGIYNIKFEDLTLYDVDMTQLIPKKTDGWIKVTTPDPTASSSEIDAEWIIGTVEAAPGETVTVPVTVKGDKEGLNSYIADLGQDAGPTANGAAAGDAYAGLGFEANTADLKFGGTNYSSNTNVVAADNATVFEVTFVVPENAAAGTIYNITFEDLEIYNYDMVQLIPKKTNGWIKIKDTEFVEESSKIDAEWIIGTVEAEPGETVTVPVTVKGDKDGLNSYIADLGQDAGPTAGDATAGDAYAALDFVGNTANLTYGATNYTLGENVVAADGAVVFNVPFTVPADAAPGTVYNITFEDLAIYNIDMVRLIPTQTNGWIKVKDDEPTTTEDPGEWIIGTVEAEPGETVTVPVTVKGDKNGLNSYIADLGQDAGPTANGAAAGDAYAGLGFEANTADLKFGGTNYTTGANVVPADGAVVFNITFKVPDDAAPGTVYDIFFENLEVIDSNMSSLTPKKTDGWIKIKDVTAETTTTTASETSETTTTTSAPDTINTTTTTSDIEDTGTTTTASAPDTIATTTTTTESDAADTTTSSTREQGSTGETTTTEPIVPNEAGEWIIGTTEVEAGATVTIPVIVKGDKNGINSYIFDMGQDAGPVANAATAGDAYAALDFAFNLDNLTFGATNYTLGENVVAADGAVVLNVTFTVPADAAPGTIYNLTFEGLTVYDINMNELTPGQTPGWIKIIDSDETTTTAAPETDDSTETTATTASEADDTTATTATTVPPAVVSSATTATTASETGDTTATTASETGDTTTTATTASETGDTTTSETGDTTTTTPGTNDVDDGGTTTTPATGESSSSETTTTSGDTPVEPANPGEWIIGTVEAKPGETVTVPVIVKGDKTGINSYIFDMGQDEGPVANGATAGDAYAALDFASNLDTLTFGGTNYTLGENIVAPDGSVVLNVTFTVPENAEPGTVYDLFFDSLKVFDIGMNELTPGQTPGWIKIIPPDATTTETTATTASEPVDETETTATTASEPVDETETTATTASETGDTTATTATTASETGDTTATTATTASETSATTTTESETAETTTTESETSATTTTESETTETTATTASETDEATTTTESETSATTTTESETSATTTTESETSATTTTESETSATTTTESETSATTTTESETSATTTTTESETSETTTTTDTKTVTGYEYEVVGKTKFYLSHDMRPFDPADLVASVVEYKLYSDGTKSEGEPVDIANVTFDVEGWTNPEEVFKGQVLGEDGKPKSDYDVYYKGTIPATVTGSDGNTHDIAAVGTAYIAVKGDATLTGEADAKDAAIVLMYAAKVGANMPAYIYSETDAELEAFAYFLTDVTGESEDNGATDSLGNAKSDCDAKDAAKILVYAAIEGSGKYADWAEVLSTPLPKYTAAIDAYKKANGWVRPE